MQYDLILREHCCSPCIILLFADHYWTLATPIETFPGGGCKTQYNTHYAPCTYSWILFILWEKQKLTYLVRESAQIAGRSPQIALLN